MFYKNTLLLFYPKKQIRTNKLLFISKNYYNSVQPLSVTTTYTKDIKLREGINYQWLRAKAWNLIHHPKK